MNHTLRRRVLIGLAPLAAAVALAGCAANATAEDGTSTSQSSVSADESSGTSGETDDSTSTTDDSTTDATSAYADGTYAAEGSYVSPAGTETIGVELTIADGVVTAVTVTPEAEDPTSAQYQEQFASGISAEVVGVALDELDVDKVAGSSLTSGGFDAAVAQIAEQASA
ncbi:FMN-binding protein [Promicromonospora sp. AC04]|uniref:FMN-binding protein n=1 Tax=Promicromonospora sp. AC04 TaxID=2135723 RepID=UPI000D348563|nr:FMN-binding protein [Promicromonospora sp. AC04]PUB28019.1 FMN-binding protein [Promicromonospora sp. AC04]